MANLLFKNEKSFYEWLTDSNSGRSIDQKRAGVVSKKSCARSRSVGAAQGNTNMDADNRLRQLLQTSNKHYCRMVNDRLLRELAPPLDAEEIGGLFAPPPWGERGALTMLERITGAGEDGDRDMVAWEPFRNNVDMDKEAHMLRSLLKPSSNEGKCHVSESMAAMKAWQRVERRAREQLRHNYQSPLVEAFEERILAYLKNAEDGEVLTLEVGNPFHRLLLHGVCEYHGLQSKTISDEDTVGGLGLVSKTYIKKKEQSKSSSSVEHVQMKLVDFLTIRKNGVQNSKLLRS